VNEKFAIGLCLFAFLRDKMAKTMLGASAVAGNEIELLCCVFLMISEQG
jgi:hypothetical protein